MKVLIALGIAALFFARGATAVAADGAAIYKKDCAKCHGETGAADTPVAKAMKVPALKGDANVEKMSAADIAARITGNAKHPAAVKSLSADDAGAVAAYVKGLAGGK
jgi:mono/diheme cytochrome c family protein